MDQVENRRNIVLLAIVAIIVIYTAVSVYWIIRDVEISQTVFVISSSLPSTGDTDRAEPLLEKIKGFFQSQHEVMTPLVQKVTIKGRVIYTNGSPFAHGLVELHSEPRTTYTDSEGYFIFEDVEDGEHTISVLGRNREVLASCKVVINRNIEIDDAILVQLPDGTLLLEVAVDVKVLEILLEIEQDQYSQPTGRLIISVGMEVLERFPPGDQPNSPDQEDNNISDEPEEIPPSDSPGGSTNPPSAGALDVYSSDNLKQFSNPAAAAADINIFGSSKRIAPGMTGKYRFTVDNTANSFGVYYDIDLIETNNTLNIPMKYRLMNNNTRNYVNDDQNWHSTAEIRNVTANSAIPLSMNHSSRTDYTLEWFWDDGGQIDNSYAENHAGEVVCTLTIQVSAQRK